VQSANNEAIKYLNFRKPFLVKYKNQNVDVCTI